MSKRNVGVCYGGYKREYPHVKKRKFDDNRRKRTITITAHKYYGIGTHWYVVLSEETNFWWIPEENAWRSFWDDDSDMKGFHISERFNTIKDARKWIEKFKKQKRWVKHKFIDNAEQEFRWCYKDGD